MPSQVVDTCTPSLLWCLKHVEHLICTAWYLLCVQVWFPVEYTVKSSFSGYKYAYLPHWDVWKDLICRALCGLRGCKNTAHSVSWPEVVKAVPNQGLDCFVSQDSFFCFSFVFLMYVVLCLIVFGCQYQCNWLPGKTRLRYDLLCVEWDVKHYTLTHSLDLSNCIPCYSMHARMS